ncbi:hypothetical protein BSKO_02125 [Bryopsis sp. KO-2023]|nr:hypothetical protein BSKO_02125 [Bryopsis sp. KO-2023]
MRGSIASAFHCAARYSSFLIQRGAKTSAAPVYVGVEHLSGENEGISVVSLNRPAAKNALSYQLLSELGITVASLAENWKVRCVVFKSAVPNIFCAGADLKERAKMSPAEAGVMTSKIRGTFADVSNIPVPTIALVEGPAIGGGTELALACDFRVGSGDARFALPETKLGIIPGGGGTQRLPRLIGLSKAKELIFTGRSVDCDEAAKIGILDFLDYGLADKKAMSLARDIVQNGAPLALRAAKRAIDRGSNVKMDTALDLEGQFCTLLLPTKDRLEGLKSFEEKRKPNFTGQ